MKLFSIVLSGAAAVVLAAGCSKSGNNKPVEMRVKWEAGRRYTNEMSMIQLSHMEVPGMPNAVDPGTMALEDFTISALKALTNGSTQMAMDFSGAKLEVRMGSKIQMSFDAHNSPDTDKTNSAAPILRKIVGAHFDYEVDAMGRANHITGMDEFLAHVPAGDEQAAGMLKNLINEALIQQFATRGQGLPPEPVKVGDHWTAHLDESGGPAGMLQMDMNYIFTGWEDHGGRRCALIDFNGQVTSKPGSGKEPAQLSLENGTLSGKMWFSPELNMVVDTGANQLMTFKIISQGKTINSLMKQSVDIRLLGVSEAAK